MARKKMGRPPKPPAEKMKKIVSVKMTASERKRLEAEAKRLGISLSALLMRPWRTQSREEG